MDIYYNSGKVYYIVGIVKIILFIWFFEGNLEIISDYLIIVWGLLWKKLKLIIVFVGILKLWNLKRKKLSRIFGIFL